MDRKIAENDSNEANKKVFNFDGPAPVITPSEWFAEFRRSAVISKDGQGVKKREESSHNGDSQVANRLEYRRDKDQDWVILVNPDGIVESDWRVDKETLEDFCDCTQNANDWESRGGDEHQPHQYGVLVALRMGHTLYAVDVELWEKCVATH